MNRIEEIQGRLSALEREGMHLHNMQAPKENGLSFYIAEVARHVAEINMLRMELSSLMKARLGV